MREIEFRAWLKDEKILVKTIIPTRKGSKGWYLENGYIMRKVNYHPKANSRGYVSEHRLVMEQHLGRFLSTNEVVHHKNGNRSDNELNNLELIYTNSEHIKNKHQQKRNDNGQFVCNEPIFNEIEFRLFDKDRKVTLIYTLRKLISTTFRRSKFEFRGRFTGLKDKNGVKIFEGDIVKDEKQRLFVIEYKFGGFNLAPLIYFNDEFSWNPLGDMQNAGFLNESCEVIGNIYENKDLLR